MRINEAISELRSLKPNQYSDETLLRWLSDLDGQIYEEVLKNAEDAPFPPLLPYKIQEDMDKELLAPFPHEGLYISYLGMQVDFHNGEYTRYNNGMVMFNLAYQMFADAWTRNHMPKQDGVIYV